MSPSADSRLAALSGVVVWRCSSFHQSASSGVASGKNALVKICRNAALRAAPALTHQHHQRFEALAQHACPFARQPRAQPPIRISAETRSGLTRGIGGRDRGTLRDADHRRALDPGGVEDGREIGHEVLEADRRRVPVRQPVAARVVADEQ